ncbi:hypothetical protein AVEN_11337-1 [Araneus ventricosus]|uniref:Uncharacterized protein n=1 Tax=Araneus ventricosus TaxID=182803 RepID=A0A4Y2WKH8_ARAVE|nr:hypothetical protein AVEN_11337-1 [Araneus ventricosus]
MQCRNALTWVTIITLFKGSFHHFFLFVSREEKAMPDRRSDAFRLHYTPGSSEPGLPPADNPGATLGSIETQKLNDTITSVSDLPETYSHTTSNMGWINIQRVGKYFWGK